MREKAIQLTRDEVPHSVTAEVEEIEGKVVRVAVYVETDSQKQILVGKGGAMVREIGTRARPEIEALLGQPCSWSSSSRCGRSGDGTSGCSSGSAFDPARFRLASVTDARSSGVGSTRVVARGGPGAGQERSARHRSPDPQEGKILGPIAFAPSGRTTPARSELDELLECAPRMERRTEVRPRDLAPADDDLASVERLALPP